jgi:amino acid adenylation domain-containing protein
MLREKESLAIAVAASQGIKERDYWLGKLSDPPAVTCFPCDRRIEPPGKSVRGPGAMETERFGFSRELSAKLADVSGGSEARVFMVLAAGLTALVHKYTGKTDIILGTSVTRQEADFRLINGVLALRSRVEGNMTFKELIYQVKETFLGAVENQDYPFETILYKVGIADSESGPSLFDIVILLESLHEKEYILHTAPNMIFSFGVSGGSIWGELEYNAVLYSEAMIVGILCHLETLLGNGLSCVETALARLDMLPERERERLLYGFNATAVDYPADKTIQRLFEEQVERGPDVTAVVDTEGSGFVTYGLLNRKAGVLAAGLRARGLGADSIAALLVDRPIDMVVGLMAVLKAGGAYLPLGLNYPAQRKKYILQDSGALLLLVNSFLIESHREVLQWMSPGAVVPVDAGSIPGTGEPVVLQDIAVPGNLAYVLYTSGTTGRPKGVMIEHCSVVNLLTWYGRAYNPGKGCRVLQLTDYTFDPSVEDIFGTLLHGATLYIGGKELAADREQFGKYIEKHGVNLVDFVPTVLSELLCTGQGRGSLEAVISGGEVLTEAVKQKIIEKGYSLYNHYGPTETTVDALVDRCSAAGVTLGRPLANVTCYILDNHYCPLPLCVPGELFISGVGPARGYLNNPGLTARKFIKNPFVRGRRMYRTGDLVRRLPGGKIEFLGRLDRQVKIRGHRIELSGIEACLAKHRDIKEAVVIAGKNEKGETGLYAYFVPVRGVSGAALREYLSGYLPAYMVPGYFGSLEKLPLTPNGKVDRGALSVPGVRTGKAYAAPRDECQEKLAVIWSEVLGIEKESIGINTGFFELGGHSLNATIVISRIRQEFRVDVPLVELFRGPTIESLAGCIADAEKGVTVKGDGLVLLKPGIGGSGRVGRLFLVHDGTGGVEGYNEFCSHGAVGTGFDIWGIRAPGSGWLAPQNLTVEGVARDYIEKIKSIQARGPYHIAGWSIGGTIAFEMVRQLEQMGERTGFAALMDTAAPGKNLHSEAVEFTVESELNLVRRYFPADVMTCGLEETGGVDGVWSTLVEYLEANRFDVETIKGFVPADFLHPSVPPGPMGIKEFISYLNRVRTFDNACNRYFPRGETGTVIHFFKAGDTGISEVEKWNACCRVPVRLYDVPGDHFSIFKKPGVEALAKLFGKVMVTGTGG